MRALASLVPALLVGAALGVAIAPPGPGGAPDTSLTDPLPTSTTGVTTGPDDVPVVDGNWSRLVFNASGPAGSWVYAYHPFPDTRTSIRYHAAYDATVRGDGREGALFIPGSLAVVDDNDRIPGFRLGDFPYLAQPPLVVGDGTLHLQSDGRPRASGTGGGTTITGVLIAMGSTAPWNVSLTFDLRDVDGPTTRPSYVYTNASGLHFMDDVERALPGDRVVADEDDFVNHVELTGDVPNRGWTLTQIMYEAVQPDGYREAEAWFPDGVAFEKHYNWHGRKLGSGCSAAGGPIPQTGDPGPIIMTDVAEFFTTYTDVPGPLGAELFHAEASTDVSLAAIHVPIEPEDLPDGHTRGAFAGGWFPCDGTR